MHFHAKTISATASGDYYQLVLEAEGGEDDQPNHPDQSAPYLLLQRQFESRRIVSTLVLFCHGIMADQDVNF